MTTSAPLAGYRVLELAHLVAGPACGLYLGDMGADVIKIEAPGSGDASRTAYGSQYGGESAVFLTVNRNKRIRTPAPALGEHTDAVLAEAGFTRAEIDALRAAGVVG